MQKHSQQGYNYSPLELKHRARFNKSSGGTIRRSGGKFRNPTEKGGGSEFARISPRKEGEREFGANSDFIIVSDPFSRNAQMTIASARFRLFNSNSGKQLYKEETRRKSRWLSETLIVCFEMSSAAQTFTS